MVSLRVPDCALDFIKPGTLHVGARVGAGAQGLCGV